MSADGLLARLGLVLLLPSVFMERSVAGDVGPWRQLAHARRERVHHASLLPETHTEEGRNEENQNLTPQMFGIYAGEVAWSDKRVRADPLVRRVVDVPAPQRPLCPECSRSVKSEVPLLDSSMGAVIFGLKSDAVASALSLQHTEPLLGDAAGGAGKSHTPLQVLWDVWHRPYQAHPVPLEAAEDSGLSDSDERYNTDDFNGFQDEAPGDPREEFGERVTEQWVPSVVRNLAAGARLPSADFHSQWSRKDSEAAFPWLLADDATNWNRDRHSLTLHQQHRLDHPLDEDNRSRRSLVHNTHDPSSCRADALLSTCGEYGVPHVQDSNVVMVGSSDSWVLEALRGCGRRLRVRVRGLTGVWTALRRFRDHAAHYQLLVYVRSDGAEAVSQLQHTLRAMADLFGGYSLVYLPEPTPPELTTTAYQFCPPGGGGPCRWTDDLRSVLAATRRLTRRGLLVNRYSSGAEFCGLPCGGATAARQVAGWSLPDQLRELTRIWCRSRWHTMVEILLPDKIQLFPTKPLVRSHNSLSIKDILPLNMKLYDKNRPPKYRGEPTIVYFHVTVITLDSINEESMTYVADVFLAQSWRDHRLRLPENMTEEYRILDVNWLLNIWRPDCIFKNAKKVTFHEMSVPNHYLWLYKDKTLLYMSKLTLVLSCAMKFETYPHDTQSCSMMIESLSHTTFDLIFKWNVTDPLMVNPEIELPQLDIAQNNTEDCTLAYSTGNFTCLAVVFHLRRRLGYHLFHTYIPSALIVVMSWISFWIKPEAIPARVTLGVTSLLTLATQNQQSQQSLPPVSYVKAIDVWMSSCSVFVFASLMEFAVVNNFMGPVATKSMKGYSEEDISTADDKSLRSTLSRSRRLFSSGTRTPPPLQPQYVTFCHGREVALYIDKMSRVGFPLAFCILNVVYWTSYLDWEEPGDQ